MKKPCSEMFCLRNQDITDAKAFFIYFLCRTQVMLDKVATYFENEVDNAVDGLTSMMEPLIMAVLGVLVGGLVIAMYLPIFQMGSVV